MILNYSKEKLNFYGIYKIINTETNDFYIGSTIESFRKRIYKHKSDFMLNKSNSLLYKAFKKYNIQNFEFIILKAFKNRKDSKRTKEIITYFEEKYIRELNPKYNICKHPTLSGCPNLGIKLTDEWKKKIGEKSKLYKHDKETLKIVTKNNKENGSKYIINDIFEGTLIECSNFFKVHPSTILNIYNNKYVSKNIKKVIKVKSQKKKIKLYNDKEVLIFNSFNECDRYFNMWRGFTSTQILKNKKYIFNFKIDIFTKI